MNSFVRWLPATGLLAAVALALTGLISPPPPVAGAPATEIAEYYARHHTGLEIESVADGLGVMLLVIFAATFHARLRTIPSLTAFGAAAIVAACTLVQVAVFHTLAFRASPDPTRAVVLNDLQTFAFQVTTFPTLLFLGAAGTAILPARFGGIRCGSSAGCRVGLLLRTVRDSGCRRPARHRGFRCPSSMARRLLRRDARPDRPEYRDRTITGSKRPALADSFSDPCPHARGECPASHTLEP